MTYGNKAIYCDSPDKIPKKPHWAILTCTTVHTEGDQRSRDFPGHGYPASSSNYIEYKAFLDENDWKAEIAEMSEAKYGRKQFTAIHVQVATIKATVSVDIS